MYVSFTHFRYRKDRIILKTHCMMSYPLRVKSISDFKLLQVEGVGGGISPPGFSYARAAGQPADQCNPTSVILTLFSVLLNDEFVTNAYKVLPIFLLQVVTAGCFLFPKEEEILAPPLVEETAITYQTRTAMLGDIENRINVTGNFEYAEVKPLYFEYRGGRLRNIYANFGDRVKENDVIAELDTDDLQFRIKQQELQIRKSELQYDRLRALGSDQFQLNMAALDTELEQLKLQALHEELKKTRILAPLDGVIIYRGKYFSGDYVNAFSTVAQIADPREMILAYRGFDAGKFPMDAKVDVSFRKEDYTGKVIMTPLYLPPDTPDEYRDTILVRLDTTPPEIEHGERATITLSIEKHENTIVLPRNLVRNYLNRSFVYILEDGIKKERIVETGIETATEVEIVKGIQEGDEVIER